MYIHIIILAGNVVSNDQRILCVTTFSAEAFYETSLYYKIDKNRTRIQPLPHPHTYNFGSLY